MNSHWNGDFSCFDLVSRTKSQAGTLVRVADLVIGAEDFIVMAGPCSVENERQILSTAEFVRSCGAKILRGGAFKPRSSPYSFQGLGIEGLRLLKKAHKETGLATVSEVMSELDVELVSEYVQILQIGARSMDNFALLEAAGRSSRPVLLKRGMCASLRELMHSAQVIVENGNPNVMLCERGIRTFEPATRFTFDVSAVPVLHTVSHLPVIVDPSHAAGVRELVPALARAAVAIGADGLLVEVHPSPKKAMSDGDQSLTFEDFRSMMRDLEPYVELRNRARRTASAAAAGGD
jgi:3-deoxy-7-phosphoheptulonate synthase